MEQAREELRAFLREAYFGEGFIDKTLRGVAGIVGKKGAIKAGEETASKLVPHITQGLRGNKLKAAKQAFDASKEAAKQASRAGHIEKVYHKVAQPFSNMGLIKTASKAGPSGQIGYQVTGRGKLAAGAGLATAASGAGYVANKDSEEKKYKIAAKMIKTEGVIWQGVKLAKKAAIPAALIGAGYAGGRNIAREKAKEKVLGAVAKAPDIEAMKDIRKTVQDVGKTKQQAVKEVGKMQAAVGFEKDKLRNTIAKYK